MPETNHDLWKLAARVAAMVATPLIVALVIGAVGIKAELEALKTELRLEVRQLTVAVERVGEQAAGNTVRIRGLEQREYIRRGREEGARRRESDEAEP